MTGESTKARRIALRRKSKETEVLVDLNLAPGTPSAAIDSGIGFLNHMLTSLATHAGWALALACRGDLVVDDHHSAEDCALALGEALARAVVDLSGRAYCRTELGLGAVRLGELAGENVAHFFQSLASAARMTLHVDVLAGENSHHKAEAAFKALALAFREALAVKAARAPSATASSAAAAATASAGRAASGPESTKGAVLLEEIGPADWAREAARMKGGKNA